MNAVRTTALFVDHLPRGRVMLFTVPPENAGQIVEVAYACSPAGLVRRTLDHSDRSVTYALADVTAEPWYEHYQPRNGAPPDCEWRSIDATELEALWE